MKYCLCCGRIYSNKFDFSDEIDDNHCISEHFLLTEDTEVSDEMFYNFSNKEKDEYEQKIYNICKQSEFFNEEKYKRKKNPKDYYFTYRFDRYEQLSGEKAWTKENYDYHTMLSQKRVAEALRNYTPPTSPQNVPKCPTCQSTNIRKIGGVERGVSIGLFGLFSRKINKSFKCNSCGYTW